MALVVVTAERLIEEPYASIVCYPMATKTELRKRLVELRKLGIAALEFAGEKQVFNVHVLGKGCVGIVTIAYKDGEKVALKIRRTDADRASMRREAAMLKKANVVSVGPRLLGVSKDFLIMQFIEGELLPKWLEEKVGRARMKRVLRDVLEQCWRLDVAGLDHGELSHAPKHLIVTAEDNAFIVDFESASVNRRPSNVTSVCQFLFISEFSRKVAERLDHRDKRTMIDSLRRYKKIVNRKNFEKVLESCGL
ncbi:MAG: RIO1 family regulatory kinase/ATPase [Candidatus Bathyarchaeia archaeon]